VREPYGGPFAVLWQTVMHPEWESCIWCFCRVKKICELLLIEVGFYKCKAPMLWPKGFLTCQYHSFCNVACVLNVLSIYRFPMHSHTIIFVVCSPLRRSIWTSPYQPRLITYLYTDLPFKALIHVHLLTNYISITPMCARWLIS
jgi:hypothetical protein